MSDYLIEIGVEELPAKQVEMGLNQFRDLTEKLLKENGVEFSDIRKLATARRLALIIKGLKANTEEEDIEVKGPSYNIAFDEDGNPSKALLGFMKSQGIDEKDIFKKEINGVEYVYGNVKLKKLSLQEILQSIMPKVIRGITFPRSMRWGGKNLKFARPIRWILSLLDDKVISFELEGIPVSNDTYGHRFLSQGKLTIFNVDEYEEKLEKAFVIVDQEERKALIKSQVDRTAKEHGGMSDDDSELLDEVNYLVEYPTTISGSIKEEYMSLPPEVIITPMKDHLRFFPIIDDSGKLKPLFISVVNNGDEYVDIVREGNAKVLTPRLEDAKFFYEEDTKIPLADYLEGLKKVTFHEKLGTLYQKTERLRQISKKYGHYLSVGKDQIEAIDRVAMLSKCDLITKMVGEFTELQGVMGGIYAEKSKEDLNVSNAISEQYLPQFAGDKLPKSTIGSVISLADKFDTISGMFAVGIKPTGSEDPFGLRRAAIGILNILFEKNIKLYLEDFIMDSLYAYVDINGLVFDYNTVKSEIAEFFEGRFRTILSDLGIRYDIVDATTKLSYPYLENRGIAIFLNDRLESKTFKDLMSGYTRIKSMAEKSENREFDEGILKEEDKKLLNAYTERKKVIDEATEDSNYETVMVNLAALEEPINKYMDDVMIMVDDEKLKNARLGLLKSIKDTFDRLCDFSKVVV